LNVDLDGNVMA